MNCLISFPKSKFSKSELCANYHSIKAVKYYLGIEGYKDTDQETVKKNKKRLGKTGC